jgi:hypothetical protein
MSKTGRNERCPCGSGKKYKHCCGSLARLDNINRVAAETIQRALTSKVQRERQQGHGKPIISAEVGGHRLVAVKNRLMQSQGWKTFHDFLGDYLKAALGVEWGTAELAKPPEQRHPVLVWYQKLCELQRRFFTEPGKVSSAVSTGASAAYLHLAYDLYALDHNAELQDKLVARLRDHDNFAGARYEVFVAAAFIRAGFDVEFEDEGVRSTKHCEFTATHRGTGKRFSVEAKRREGDKLRVGRLLNKALLKHAAHTRVVFIDVNEPDDATDESKPEYLDPVLRGLRAFEGRLLNGRPRPPAYVFITNTPLALNLDGDAPRCCIIPEGFQIPEFKGNGVARSLRQAIDARKGHREMHDLLESVRDHTEVPATFDGSIPEYTFGTAIPILIGQRYMVPGPDGVERPGVVTSATVAESERKAYCMVAFDDGMSAMCTMPLSNEELAAWKRHPDTFFGVLGQRRTRADTPLQMYDFWYESTQQTSRERLLEAMAMQPDLNVLETLDQPALADIWAERLTHGMLAQQRKSSAT